MSITSTDVANKALAHIGSSPIDSINDNTKEAVSLKAHIDDCREIFLREAAPGFARKEVALAIASNETSSIYTYVYTYPADCKKIRQIWNGTTNDDPRIEFETGAHSSGSSEVILTDREDAVLIYTRDIKNYDMFSKEDINVLALLLAWKTVHLIKRDRDLRARIEREYGLALAISKKNNKREQHVPLPDNDRYVNSRR